MALGEALRSWNYEAFEAGRISEAHTVFDREEPSVALLDIDLPDGSGLDLLSDIKEKFPDTIVVMVTGNETVENTIAALRGGAHDFIGKPIRLEELRVTLRNALETRQLRREVKQARQSKSEFGFANIIGESAAITRAIELARRVAESDVMAILLQGETGTGKDLFARALHYASERRTAPYLAINCAAIPATLIESELFGYEKGAFTDAKARKEGLFEQAEGGTLFLDEIGELELGLQAKLLRVLEEGSFRRVGGLKDIPLDVRIVAASNRDLRAESEAGKFRLDLYYRLSVIQIDIPPLRERGDDILLLAEHYIRQFGERLKLRRKIRGLSPEVADAFRRYPWPGNVRELRNVIERALILEDADLITPEYLPRDLAAEAGYAAPQGSATPTHPAQSAAGSMGGFALPPGGLSLDELETALVRQAVARSGGNQTRAAELLGISRDQLRYRLKKIGADDEAEAASAEKADA